jgi:lysophospholipase L1-like esterase
MRIHRYFRRPMLWLGVFLLASCSTRERLPSATPAPAAPASATRPDNRAFVRLTEKTDASLRLVPASDPRFSYEGRIDFSDPAAPVIIWQASRIGIDFEGDRLALCFERVSGQSYFNVQVDDAQYLVGLRDGRVQCFRFERALGPGRHRLTLFKRSEANAGTVRFLGIQVANGAQVWRPAPTDYRLAMLFVGDSITVGACNEDGPKDQWDNRATHNNALSYAALTAQAFSADYRNIAVSGMGVVTGWVSVHASQIWNRLYPRTNSATADLKSWQPNVVFVLLGDNDNSFTRDHHRPFPATFADAYVALIRSIREAYPAAHLVLLRGGMYGGMQSVPLREAWDQAVARLETDDPNVSHFVFVHWSKNHPRVADDRALADELIAWLGRQDFMQPYLPSTRN